ncbi:hypothetical protein [Bradyrhizobium sp. CB1015]|uniref:hypothetical protein n=1 Tax=Bradyrhizobium sp. CB1015 TaxID=2976822 RepID=UPI0021AA0838|nr:hypothetical protein [Bradyrhizobium sp. CB1015]UWU92948.1 hypothetical protein N2604_03020 [Bradyrhizobium sp. CB1015]
MLLERTTKLVADVGQFAKMKRSAGEAKALQTRAEQLSPVAEKLAESAETLAKIRKAGIIVSFMPKERDELGKRTADLLTALRADPNNLVNPAIDLKYQFIDRLLSVATAAQSVSLAAWRRHVAENSEHAPEEILSALAAIPDYQSTVARIRSLQKRVSHLAETVPADPANVTEEIKRIAAEHREIWEMLTEGGIPDDVTAFLRACGLDGATLGSFTPSVAAWLGERGLIHLFRIKLR